MSHAYPRAHWLLRVVGENVLLAGVLVFALVAGAKGPLYAALVTAIPLVMLWGFATLHFPSRVIVDERGITFHGYGRAHRFEWSEVEKVSVRRFLVRDRVLVRVSPSPPWRGRYWILSGIERFDELVTELERRG